MQILWNFIGDRRTRSRRRPSKVQTLARQLRASPWHAMMKQLEPLSRVEATVVANARLLDNKDERSQGRFSLKRQEEPRGSGYGLSVWYNMAYSHSTRETSATPCQRAASLALEETKYQASGHIPKVKRRASHFSCASGYSFGLCIMLPEDTTLLWPTSV